MPTARDILKRIRSVKNIAQITRALEAVSASRVRLAQARALASRAYAEKAWEILLNIQKDSTAATLHPLLTKREEVKNILVIVITSDRGLAGAYNTNIVRVAERFTTRLAKPVSYVTIGRKGRDSLIRARAKVLAEFSNSANPSAADVHPAAQLAIDEFLSGRVDEVFIAYTDFINMLTQRPVVLSMLPLMPYTTDDLVVSELVKEAPEVSEGSLQYEYEPSAAAILDEIVPRFTELQLYHAVLESQASEHAARMVAMRNASENATALSNDLRLAYNKARQAAITAEILDIVGGAEALAETLEAQAAEMLATVQAERRATPAPAAVAVAGNSGRTKASAKAKSAPAAEPIAAETPAPTSIPKRAGKTAKAAKARSDDLKIIDGIGPKMEKALQAAGIDSYEKLSQASEDQLREAVQAAGMQLAPTLATWAKQAEFLARGDHDGLQAYQESLKKN